nr:MAG TPA: hypothetical protein [Caudoviricetes sp.]
MIISTNRSSCTHNPTLHFLSFLILQWKRILPSLIISFILNHNPKSI